MLLLVALLGVGPESVASELGAIEQGLKATKYEHRLRVDRKRGVYNWDCSIMAAWVLARTAPEAHRTLGAKPLARDFYRVIDKAPVDKPRRGWQRLADVATVGPGDLFAWLKPPMFKQRPNTGHVGFVIGKPWRHPRYDGVWLIRIADATRELHGDDSRPSGGEGGFGTATIAFLTNPSGMPIAYGWYGESQDPATYVPTQIVFGRVAR